MAEKFNPYSEIDDEDENEEDTLDKKVESRDEVESSEREEEERKFVAGWLGKEIEPVGGEDSKKHQVVRGSVSGEEIVLDEARDNITSATEITSYLEHSSNARSNIKAGELEELARASTAGGEGPQAQAASEIDRRRSEEVKKTLQDHIKGAEESNIAMSEAELAALKRYARAAEARSLQVKVEESPEEQEIPPLEDANEAVFRSGRQEQSEEAKKAMEDYVDRATEGRADISQVEVATIKPQAEALAAEVHAKQKTEFEKDHEQTIAEDEDETGVKTKEIQEEIQEATETIRQEAEPAAVETELDDQPETEEVSSSEEEKTKEAEPVEAELPDSVKQKAEESDSDASQSEEETRSDPENEPNDEQAVQESGIRIKDKDEILQEIRNETPEEGELSKVADQEQADKELGKHLSKELRDEYDQSTERAESVGSTAAVLGVERYLYKRNVEHLQEDAEGSQPQAEELEKAIEEKLGEIEEASKIDQKEQIKVEEEGEGPKDEHVPQDGQVEAGHEDEFNASIKDSEALPLDEQEERDEEDEAAQLEAEQEQVEEDQHEAGQHDAEEDDTIGEIPEEAEDEDAPAEIDSELQRIYIDQDLESRLTDQEVKKTEILRSLSGETFSQEPEYEAEALERRAGQRLETGHETDAEQPRLLNQEVDGELALDSRQEKTGVDKTPDIAATEQGLEHPSQQPAHISEVLAGSEHSRLLKTQATAESDKFDHTSIFKTEEFRTSVKAGVTTALIIIVLLVIFLVFK